MELVRKGNNLRDSGRWEDEWACEDGVWLEKGLECEGSYYAEVLACAADGPVEVGMGGWGGGYDGA